jgi:hypothetical protein
MMQARTDLQGHLSPVLASVKLANKLFIEGSQKIMDCLYNGDLSPTRSQTNLWNLDNYWNAISIEFEALSTIWVILSHCIPSEAANERVFSLEGLIHNKVFFFFFFFKRNKFYLT